jgi:hypothetical protein
MKSRNYPSLAGNTRGEDSTSRNCKASALQILGSGVKDEPKQDRVQRILSPHTRINKRILHLQVRSKVAMRQQLYEIALPPSSGNKESLGYTVSYRVRPHDDPSALKLASSRGRDRLSHLLCSTVQYGMEYTLHHIFHTPYRGSAGIVTSGRLIQFAVQLHVNKTLCRAEGLEPPT